MAMMEIRCFIRRAAAAVPALCLVVSGLGCTKGNEYVAPPPPQVTVSRPVQKTVTDYAEFNGVLEAAEFVEIRARVEGTLESIHFKPGARVKEGELLFVIDPKPFQAKLDEAGAELQRRLAELEQAKATLKRKELAYRASAVSEVEVIQATADRDVAKAAVEAARAAIRTAELNLSYTRIHAPIDGRIGLNLVDEGNLVGAGERTILATIVRDDPIHAYFSLNERDLLNYRRRPRNAESPANGDGDVPIFLGLSTQPDYPYEGRIDFLDNRVDPSTGTIKVRGTFSNSRQALWAGLFARIRVPVGTLEGALLVPESAVGTDQRGDYLLVVNDRNMVEYRAVKTGPIVDGFQVIDEGLSPGDRVVVNGLQRARPGIPVNPVEAGAQAPAPASAQANPT